MKTKVNHNIRWVDYKFEISLTYADICVKGLEIIYSSKYYLRVIKMTPKQARDTMTVQVNKKNKIRYPEISTGNQVIKNSKEGINLRKETNKSME